MENADEAQRKISEELERCYPPIPYRIGVLAVEASGSHFSGPAYIRQGSKTVVASPEMFRELVASQNEKARWILQFKDKQAWLRIRSKSGFWFELQCTVREYDAISVTLKDNESLGWRWKVLHVKTRH